MLSHPGLGRCQVVQARVDVESSGLGSILGRRGPGRCRFVRDRADVEWSGHRSMLNRVGPRRSASKLSRIRPSSSQVSLCPFQNGFNVFDKVDLI